MNASLVALLVAVIAIVLLGLLCYRLLLDRGRLLLRAEQTAPAETLSAPRGVPAGSYLTDFALPRLATTEAAAEVVAFSSLTGTPLLLAFLRADCLFSRAFARELAAQERKPAAPLLVAIVIGETAVPDALFADLPGVVLRDTHGQLARLLRITATPSGHRVDASRRTIGARLEGPLALLATARGDAAAPAAPLALTPLPARPSSRLQPLPPGTPAPDFTLPLLGGGQWSLAAQRGAPLLLLFVDPACPPCLSLLRELRLRQPPGLAIVSRGDAAENQQLIAEHGIAAPVLLQAHHDVARAFGTLETPALFLIGADGEIVAGPAVGKEAAIDLILRLQSGKIRPTHAETRPA